jgi:hypothetical protein
MTDSSEIVTWRSSLDEVMQALTTVGTPLKPPKDIPLLDAEQVQAAISGRILAMDADAALSLAATAAPLAGEDLIGIPIEITGGEFMPSNKKGPGFYMLLAYRNLADGNIGLISTGSNTVMSQLARRLCEDGPWPTPPIQWARREQATDAGGYPEWLEPVPAEDPAD